MTTENLCSIDSCALDPTTMQEFTSEEAYLHARTQSGGVLYRLQLTLGSSLFMVRMVPPSKVVLEVKDLLRCASSILKVDFPL